jgi:hypothetical protein
VSHKHFRLLYVHTLPLNINVAEGMEIWDRFGIWYRGEGIRHLWLHKRALQTLQSMPELTEHTQHTQLIDDTPQRRDFVIIVGFVLFTISTAAAAVDLCHGSVVVVL